MFFWRNTVIKRIVPLCVFTAALCVQLSGCVDIEGSVPVHTEGGGEIKEVFLETSETSAASDNVSLAEAPLTEQTDSSAETSPAQETELSLPEESEETPEQAYASVRLLCAGDNLIHTPIYRNAALYANNEGYDFMPCYEHLGTLISDADLAILNQETIITDDFPPDTYPSFCTPSQMAEDMTELGFDVFSVSNNHVLDKGERGLISTLGFWRDYYPDVPVYGAYLDEDDMNDIRTLTVNGITFAFLGYMEHTNGLKLPQDSQCRLVYLSEEELIKEQIEKADELADCVVVSAHFGIEVSNTVTQQQYELSRKFAEWGADIIIGTQPHTIQTMEYLDKPDGKAFVFYCLGNFISCMDDPLSMPEILGEITVTKDLAAGEIVLSDACAVPLVDYYDSSYSYVGVYPLSMYTSELSLTHAVKGADLDSVLKLFRENIPREFMSEEYVGLIYG